MPHDSWWGVYLWESHEAADALYNGPIWAPRIRELYGVDPAMQWFHCSVVAETALGTMVTVPNA